MQLLQQCINHLFLHNRLYIAALKNDKHLLSYSVSESGIWEYSNVVLAQGFS